ncbi:MAG: ABC transporter ATP-binding protein [Candidatus Methanomethylophilaceae archaeon]|nr:ABC transporter ATP-binding protein [Candidatus Methanomethylophilaceae archaeon]NLF33643.1 ABC transporter ATP-binding protein [Thermoplasmatales archaeon]
MEDEHANAYAITADGLTRSFGRGPGEKTAVDGITFRVRRGQIFGILGPNGAGKTTTVKMLSTLLLPTSGRATVLGVDLSDHKAGRMLRSRINTVSGGERGLYYRLSGRQNLQFFADLYGIPKRDQKTLIDGLLDMVGLSDAADMKVENYSRGMKQRIHIARALVNSPEVLFLDEPTVGLDPEISRQIRALVRRLADGGTTVVLTTHYMYEAEELCEETIIISRGRIVGSGTVGDIKGIVSESTVVRVVTDADPLPAAESVRTYPGVRRVSVQSVGGRFDVRIDTDGEDGASMRHIEDRFREYGIRSIGYDEPTLEDAYLRLVEGEP